MNMITNAVIRKTGGRGSTFLEGDEKPPVEYSMMRGKFAMKRRNNLTAIKIIDLKPSDMTSVSRNAYTLGSPNIDGPKYLFTRGLDKGFAILAYNEENRVGMLAHVGSPLQAIQALQRIQIWMEPSKVMIYGGSNSSEEILSAIEGYVELSENSSVVSAINVVGQNTTRGRHELPRSIGLDTNTGELFTLYTSKLIGVYPRVPLAATDSSLEYYSSHGTPLSKFIGRMQKGDLQELARK